MNIRTKRLLLVACAFLVVAPAGSLAQDNPRVGVSDPQVTYDVNARFNLRTANSTTSSRAPVSITQPIAELSALFRNMGTKAIKSLTWEYIYFEDATEAEVLKVHTSRTKTMLLPGESVRLKKVGYHLIPARTMKTWHEKAKVIEIEYVDGTTWRGAKTRN